MIDGDTPTDHAADTAADSRASPERAQGLGGIAESAGAPPSAVHTAAAKEVEVGSKFYEVQFRVHVSMRYHQARRAWWTNLNRLSSAFAALAGSAALIAVFGKSHEEIWAWISAGSGAIAALNSALAFTERAREHADLYRGFSSIAAKMAAAESADAATGRAVEAEVLQLEASEPPIIQTLNVICHNQECQARGLPKAAEHRVYLLNRIFKSWGTLIDHFPLTTEPPWWSRRLKR